MVNGLMDVSDLICIAEKANPEREKNRGGKSALFIKSMAENILCHVFNFAAFLSFSTPKYFHPKG